LDSQRETILFVQQKKTSYVENLDEIIDKTEDNNEMPECSAFNNEQPEKGDGFSNEEIDEVVDILADRI